MHVHPNSQNSACILLVFKMVWRCMLSKYTILSQTGQHFFEYIFRTKMAWNKIAYTWYISFAADLILCILLWTLQCTSAPLGQKVLFHGKYHKTCPFFATRYTCTPPTLLRLRVGLLHTKNGRSAERLNELSVYMS